MLQRRVLWLSCGVALFTLALDQGSKLLVRLSLGVCSRAMLTACDSRHFVGFITVQRAENVGGPFGVLQQPEVWLGVSFVITASILNDLFRSPRPDRRTALAMGLQLGGALGNLLDRVLFGAVTDFLEPGVGLIFNFADIALLAGLVVAWDVTGAVVGPRDPARFSLPAGEPVGPWPGLGGPMTRTERVRHRAGGWSLSIRRSPWQLRFRQSPRQTPR
jgi:lipoprotein signal peptidase